MPLSLKDTYDNFRIFINDYSNLKRQIPNYLPIQFVHLVFLVLLNFYHNQIRFLPPTTYFCQQIFIILNCVLRKPIIPNESGTE